MQNIYILQLQGTGDLEDAFEIAGAFTTAAAFPDLDLSFKRSQFALIALRSIVKIAGAIPGLWGMCHIPLNWGTWWRVLCIQIGELGKEFIKV